MPSRPYQLEASERVRQRRAAGDRSTLIVMATGLGKTWQFASIAAEWEGRVMVLAHRRKLILQAAKAVRAICGVHPKIDLSDVESEPMLTDDRIVLSTMQSMSMEYRLHTYSPREPWLIIIDEAHRSTAKSYRDIWNWFKQGDASFLLGVTATPDRADGVSLFGPASMYESLAFTYNIDQAIPDAWLCPISARSVVVEELTAAELRVVGGDFNAEQLEGILSENRPVLQVANATIEIVGDRKTVVFAAGVGHAIRLAQAFNHHTPGSAAVVSSWPEHAANNEAVLDAFAAGKIQFLCNSDMLTEGFDQPDIAAVVRARPTKSRTIACQQIGRGTRTLEDVLQSDMDVAARRAAIANSAKPECLILDFVGDGHSLIHSADCLIPADTPADLVARFRKRMEKGASNPRDTLDELKLLKAIEEEEAERVRVLADVTFRTREIDLMKPTEPPREVRKERRGEPLTEKQWRRLVAYGVPPEVANGYSKPQAGIIIQGYMDKGKQPDWSLVDAAGAMT